MSKKQLSLFGFAILLFLGSQTLAQTLKLPYKDVGACPFECCTYRQWWALKPVKLYKYMTENSPVAFRVKKGEKVRGLTGVVITNKPGKATAEKDMTMPNSDVKLKKGDTILLLTYQGEGYFRFWFKGKFYEDDGYAEGLKMTEQPDAVWWVKVRNRLGQIGWTKYPEVFDNMDQCG